MSRPFTLEIQESEEELGKRLQAARDGVHKEKLQMLWWIKSGQVTQQQQIGQRLNKDTSTITRWLQKYRTGGLEALLQVNKAPGARRKLNDEVLQSLQQQLTSEAGFSSDGAIVQWLQQEHGQPVKYGTVHQWVRYRLGGKLKVPRPQSYQQDEESVETFKKTSVPSL